MIEGGTTGLRTWKASYVFAEWLLAHPEVVRSKRVLELGSGIGFLGILIAGIQQSALQNVASLGDTPKSKTATDSRVRPSLCLTDANTNVLARCQENVRLPCNDLDAHPFLNIHLLDWTDAIEDHEASTRGDVLYGFFQEIDPDIILGVDLVYDSTILPELIAVLRMLLVPHEHKPERRASPLKKRECWLAVSVRQDATFAEFLTRAEMNYLKVEELAWNIETTERTFLGGGEGRAGLYDLNWGNHAKLIRLSHAIS